LNLPLQEPTSRRAPARWGQRAKEVSKHALRVLVSFARCPERDAAKAQRYRGGCLERVAKRACVAILALGLGHGTIATSVHVEGLPVLVSVEHSPASALMRVRVAPKARWAATWSPWGLKVLGCQGTRGEAAGRERLCGAGRPWEVRQHACPSLWPEEVRPHLR